VSAGADPDGAPVPSNTFYTDETVYFYTKVSWDAQSPSAGVHRILYKFYTGDREVMSGGDSRTLDVNPTYWWAWQQASILGPGHHTARLFVDGERFADWAFDVKPGARPYEPAEDVALMEHARDLLLAGDTAQFDALAAAYRRSAERTASGTWKLSLLYRPVNWRSLSPHDPVWDRLQQVSDEWLARQPESVTAVLLNAHLLLDHSVSWRGEGGSVAPESSARYRDLTESVRILLDQHAALADVDPDWDVVRIRVARQQGADPRTILAMAARALDRNGYYYPLHNSAVNALLPRWGGSREAVQEYVRMALAHSREREGTQAYARIFYYMARSSSDEAFVDMNLMGESWVAMRRSLDELVQAYPSEFNRDVARAITCLAGDADAYRALGRAPTGTIESVGWWDTRTRRGECNGWAFEGKHAPGSFDARVKSYTSFLGGSGLWRWVRLAELIIVLMLEGALALLGRLGRRRASEWLVPQGRRPAFNPLDYPRSYLLSLNAHPMLIRLGVWMLLFGATATYLLTSKPSQDALETAIAVGTCLCAALAGALILFSQLTSTVTLTSTEMSIGTLLRRRTLRRDDIAGIRQIVLPNGATFLVLVPHLPEGALMRVPSVWREDEAFRLWFESLAVIEIPPVGAGMPLPAPWQQGLLLGSGSRESVFARAIGIVGAGILAFFASVPLYIAWGMIRELIDKPTDTDWRALAVIGGCLALAYFLLLLAYRAFTGRGRKSDGGLLPPWAMSTFVFLFCGLGVAIVIVGAWQRDWQMTRGGLAYCVTATFVYFAWRRRKLPRTNSGTGANDPVGGY
jgi:hypothetical protein